MTGCDDVTNPTETNGQELITTVELEFVGGAAPLVARWVDLEGDGAPDVDAVTLEGGLTYSMSVRFLNALADPVQDIGAEVAAEAGEHQVFVTGPGVDGPASEPTGPTVLTQEYVDFDATGLPLGLEHSIVAVAGSTDLTITLRHLPAQGGQPLKEAGLAARVATEGLGAIPGESDAQVTFVVDIP